MADGPRSLEPAQVVLQQALSRGLLIGLPNPGATNSKTGSTDASYETLRFQYNPETVTRARTGQWERKLDKKTSQAVQEKQAIEAARGGAIKAKSEVISFKLIFDAAELIMKGGDTSAIAGSSVRGSSTSQGILPELALLERYALGPDQLPDPPKKDNEFALVSLAPTEALLVLGPRTFPGVITQMTITEQRFSTQLVPVRAEVDIRFRVLEARAIAVSKDTQQAFEELIQQRADLSKVANASAGGDLSTAISAAVAPRGKLGT